MCVVSAAAGCTGTSNRELAPSAVASASRQPTPSPVPKLPRRTFAYSTIGTTVVAIAYRVPSRTKAAGPITVVRFDPAHTRLVLHAGSAEPVPSGDWRRGPMIRPGERAHLVAAFNGGFKMQDAHGGWRSEGRTIVPLVRNAASVVIYADGGVDVGAWGREVPAPGRRVVSVRQNLQLLINRGRARRIHPPDQAVLDKWWGHAFLDAPLISRSALGVTADGALVWAAGTNITIAGLAHALLGAGVVRAMELDINAPLVRGFLFRGVAVLHTRTHGAQSALPLMIGQRQLRHDPGLANPAIAPHCTYLLPCSRDFFTVLAR